MAKFLFFFVLEAVEFFNIKTILKTSKQQANLSYAAMKKATANHLVERMKTFDVQQEQVGAISRHQ